MKLSTRSRYGTRMMLDLAKHFDEGPVQISDIAKRENISVKYLEQLIIPLKRAGIIESFRGPKGGHTLTSPPDEITIGDIVRILEGGIDLIDCIGNPECCDRMDLCLMRDIWEEATKAMYDKLDSVTLSSIIQQEKNGSPQEGGTGARKIQTVCSKRKDYQEQAGQKLKGKV